MKSLPFILLFCLTSLSAHALEHIPCSNTPEDSAFIVKQEGKFGVQTIKKGWVIPCVYSELYIVKNTMYSTYEVNRGFIGRERGKPWTYYAQTSDLKVENIVFDEWLGNGGFSDPFVLHDGKVKMFNINEHSVVSIKEYNEYDDGLEYTEEIRVPREVILKKESNNKFGVFNNYGQVKLAFEYDELYQVNNKFYAAGFMVKQDEHWSYYDRFHKIQKEIVPFDEWISNSKYSHAYVLKEGKVQMFDIETMEVLDLQKNQAIYGHVDSKEEGGLNLIRVKFEKKDAWGAFNRFGEIKLPFKYKEIFDMMSKPGMPYLGKYANGTGDFYTAKGEFIMHCKEYPYFLGIDLYLRLADSPDRLSHAALGKLDVEGKKIIMVTDYDFWFMNPAPQWEKTTRIARASYHDNKEAYIHVDGRVEPINE